MPLKTFIDDSGLVKEDKELWVSILATLTEGQIKILEDFMEGKEENLKTLTENIKAKRQAFENGNEEALEKILGGEQ